MPLDLVFDLIIEVLDFSRVHQTSFRNFEWVIEIFKSIQQMRIIHV